MDKYPKRVSKIFERNIRQINRIVANIMAICSVVILLMTFLSVTGFLNLGHVIRISLSLLVCWSAFRRRSYHVFYPTIL